MAERLKALVSKTSRLARVSRVRIPPSPPSHSRCARARPVQPPGSVRRSIPPTVAERCEGGCRRPGGRPPGAPRGEVLEWLNRLAWKAGDGGNSVRGFESHPLRHRSPSPSFPSEGSPLPSGVRLLLRGTARCVPPGRRCGRCNYGWPGRSRRHRCTASRSPYRTASRSGPSRPRSRATGVPT